MQWLQTLLSPGKKLKAGNSRHALAIEYPEPLVHFAVSSGAYSDPAVCTLQFHSFVIYTFAVVLLSNWIVGASL